MFTPLLQIQIGGITSEFVPPGDGNERNHGDVLIGGPVFTLKENLKRFNWCAGCTLYTVRATNLQAAQLPHIVCDHT